MNNKIAAFSNVIIIALFFNTAGAFAGSAEIANEQAGLIVLQESIIKDTVCCYLNMKKAEPVLELQGQAAFSADLSYGDAVAPLYLYNINDSKYPLFGPPGGILGTGEDIPCANLSLSASLPGNLLGTFDISGLPEMNYENTGSENFKIAASLYYRLLKDALFITGLYAGAGYDYTSGSIDRAVSGAYYAGSFNSGWNYNGFDAELLANNQLFIFNFYGRADYYCLFGQARASFDQGLNSIDNSIVEGIVISAGMEISFGWVKINVEAGKDFLSAGMYVNAGARFGY
ncbi:MAG: hypothetical protein ABSG94_07150 [Brevinematales bacterium]